MSIPMIDLKRKGAHVPMKVLVTILLMVTAQAASADCYLTSTCPGNPNETPISGGGVDMTIANNLVDLGDVRNALGNGGVPFASDNSEAALLAKKGKGLTSNTKKKINDDGTANDDPTDYIEQ